MDKQRLLELAGILNEDDTVDLARNQELRGEAQILNKLDDTIDQAIGAIAKLYEASGDEPMEARQEASAVVFDHLKSGQRN